MSAGIKIRLGTENERAIFDILHRFAEHKKTCFQCECAFKLGEVESYCETGHGLLYSLSQFKEVEKMEERT